MFPPAAAAALSLAALLLAAAPPAERPGTSPEAPPALLGSGYPIEVVVSRPAALLHWMDSLAGLSGPGLTAGKTRRAHLLDYEQRVGPPGAEQARLLERFARVRIDYALGAEGAERHALTLAFFEAPDLEQALAAARRLVGDGPGDALESAVRHFAPRYEAIWLDGRVPRAFVERAARERRRRALGRFLGGVAALFEVSPEQPPRPALLVVPVREGFGTHAQAIGRFLLVEIRQGEGLLDQVAPIVHENAHFLFKKMEPSRLAALREQAERAGEPGRAAWALLQEALPTAIAQGVADAKFRAAEWSPRAPWYHVPEVDALAKRIHPLVRQALAEGARLDEALFARLLAQAGAVSPR